MKYDEINKIMQKEGSSVAQLKAFQRRQILKRQGYDVEALYLEAEMNCPYVEMYRDSSDANDLIQLHSHSFCEILYCRSSSGAEYLVGPDRFKLCKGDLICICPGVSHRPLFPLNMSETYQRDVLWIDWNFMQEIYKKFPDERLAEKLPTSLLRISGRQREVLEKLFSKGIQLSEQQPPAWHMELVGISFQILSTIEQFMLNQTAQHLTVEKPNTLDQVVAYIDTHYAEKITVQSIADYFFISRSTLNHSFAKQMNIGLYRFITQRRLIAAKTWILEGMPLKSVGEKVGFNDYPTFYRAFKQEYGVSPREFEQMYRNK